ncbi:MAG: outer membrane beta-barrel protein [Bacteroidales bacterium]
MRKYYYLFLFVMSAVSLSAQQSGNSTFNGTVIDGVTNQPMEQATVRLLALPDSSLITGTVSVAKGKFTIQTKKKGEVLLSVSFIGYEPYYKKYRLPASHSPVDAGKIVLNESSQLLKEAVVQGKAPEVVLKEDTVEYNADSYKLQANSMVEDLLKKLPGVEVDSEGKITSGGKTITKVLVDGKEFFGSDTKVATKNINVDIIEKLQVIDRKSDESRLTGVDDGEEEKVINLTVKKGMKKGWFGNLSGAYGNKDRYEVNGMANRFVGDNQFSLLGGINNTNNAGFTDLGSSMFSGSGMRGSRGSGGYGNGISTSGYLGGNFNVGKGEDFRVGGNVMFAGSDQNEQKKTIRENYLQDSSTYYNQNYDALNKSRNFNLDLKMEWQIDSLTRLEVQPNLSYNKTTTAEVSDFTTTDQNDFFINRGTNNNTMDMDGFSYGARATLTRESARKAGRKVSATFSYTGNSNEGSSFIRSNTIYGDSLADIAAVRDTSIHQKQTENTTRDSYRVRLTYIEPFGNKRFLQFSYNLTNNANESRRYSYNWLENAQDFSADYDSLYSDKFRNVNLSQRIGVSVRTVRDKYNYTVGLNVDPSTSKSTNYLDEDRSYKRSVVNFGPQIDMAYIWDKRTSLRLQYRGRTQQPSINQLQPSKNITNPLIVREGNLDLNPSYVNSFSARYNKYVPETQRSLQAMVYGNMTLNSIVNQVTYNKETGVQTTKPVNVNGVWSVSGMFMYNAPLRNKNFQINSNTNLGLNQQIGFSDGEKNRSRNYSVRENAGISFRNDMFDIGLRGNYSLSRTNNTIAQRSDQTVMNYGGTGNFSIFLPMDITIGSDFTYNGKSGYAAAFARRELIWNAQTSMTFLKNKQAMVFARMYDILQQKSSISRQVTGNYIEDVQTNILTNYFLVGFTYRFNTMGKGGSKGREEIRGSGPRDGRRPSGPPPGHSRGERF